MKKWVCSVCGYVHTGDQPPAQCPQCKVPAEKFKEQVQGAAYASEHVVGIAKGVDADIVNHNGFFIKKKIAKVIFFNILLFFLTEGVYYRHYSQILIVKIVAGRASKTGEE